MLLAAMLIWFSVGISATYAKVTDFSFIHVSDEHSDDAQTTPDNLKEMARLSKLPSVFLEPYKVSTPSPSFIISTGDMTEFGPVNEDYSIIKKRYAEVGIPLYAALGNHDCTWGGSLTRERTKLYGAPYFSVDRNDCHFVIFNSAGLNDGRPILSPEEIDWLKIDLAKVGPTKPVFIAFHHPLGINEYSSQYETDRLLDVLRPYNIAAIMVGHGHTAMVSKYEGYDMVEGGSAYGPHDPGFQIYSIMDGKLKIAYKILGHQNPSKPMLEKFLAPQEQRYPEINIQSPKDRTSYNSEVIFKIWTTMPKDSIKESYVMVDEKTKVDLTKMPGGCFECRIDNNGVLPGAHYARVCFKDSSGTVFHHSTCFYVEADQPRAIWRAYLGAASRCVPSVSEGTVFVGANDGRVHALDAKTGKSKWVFKTGGAVVSQPLVMAGKVIFGSEDEKLYCVSASTGKQAWAFNADAPIYTSPVTDGTHIYFGSMSGTFFGVSAADGKLKWKDKEAQYNIMMKPSLCNGKLCYGAWDAYIYCQNTADGKLLWKCIGQGPSEEKDAAIYYSPAKVTPVPCGNRVFVSDVKSRLSIIDVNTGKQEKFLSGLATVGSSEDGNNLYLLKNDQTLSKTDGDLKEIWSSQVGVHTECAPVEYKGNTYLCSTSGLVTAVSADTGSVIWRYQATPSSYVLCRVGVSDDAVYIAGTDGSLTALRK